MQVILSLLNRAFLWGETRYYTMGYGLLLILAAHYGAGDWLFLLIGSLTIAGSFSGIIKRCNTSRTKTG